MSADYLATIRRHPILFLGPVVIAAVLALWPTLGAPRMYRSSASLWSDSPGGATNELLGAPPPATQEQTMLNELLTTGFFRKAVARRSGLQAHLLRHDEYGWGPGSLLATVRGKETLDTRVASALGAGRVHTGVEGPHVLKLDYDGPSPALALSTVRAMIAEYRRQRTVLRRDALSISRLEVEKAAQALSAARAELAEYLQDHASADPADPRLRTLSEAERGAIAGLTAATAQLSEETREALSGTGQTTLRVIDAPELPVASVGVRRQLAKSLLAGLFVGGVLSLLAAISITKTRRRGEETDDALDQRSSNEEDLSEVAASPLAERRRRFEQPGLERSD